MLLLSGQAFYNDMVSWIFVFLVIWLINLLVSNVPEQLSSVLPENLFILFSSDHLDLLGQGDDGLEVHLGFILLWLLCGRGQPSFGRGSRSSEVNKDDNIKK